MKPGIHPPLQRVCLLDPASGKRILNRSTMTSEDTAVINGEKCYRRRCFERTPLPWLPPDEARG